MKVHEIIQRVQSLYSKGCQSDDSRLSPRHIYSKLVSLRSKYISQQAKKKQKINQWNFQTLPCVELIDRKSTRLNSSHSAKSRMPSSA